MPEQTTLTTTSEGINNVTKTETGYETAVSFAEPTPGQSTIVITDSYNTYYVPIDGSESPENSTETESFTVSAETDILLPSKSFVADDTADVTGTTVTTITDITSPDVPGQEISLSTLPAETFITEASETVATTEYVSPDTTSEPDINRLGIYGVILLAGLFVAFLFFGNKRIGNKKSKTDTETYISAKERDKERIKEENSKKQKKEKKSYSFKLMPTTAIKTLPYIKILDNDIWLLADRRYSKVYSVDDVNYNLGDEEQQESLFVNYCNFLNTIDDTVECQMSVMNETLDVKQLEDATLISANNDNLNEYRWEYNQILRKNLSKGQNAITKRILISMTIRAADEISAVRRFNSIDLTIKNSFDRVGSTNLKVVSNQERCEILKSIFKDTDDVLPTFTENDYKKCKEKEYIAPDYFEFKTNYFMYGKYYAKCVFIKDFPNKAGDGILNDLIKQNIRLIITTNLFAYDASKARTLVQRQIGAITANNAQREQKAVKAGMFSTTMPIKTKNQMESYNELFDKISIEDQKLFVTSTVIMIIAETFDELNDHLELVDNSLKRSGCKFSEMKWQQEDGLADVLPIGTQRKFQWQRHMPTESVGILMPFNVKEVRQKNGIYYGLNKLSNNMITFDRIRGGLINPAGFIFGCPGSGKSFTAKREMEDGLMRYHDSDYIIIDPEREYAPVVENYSGETIKISTSSKNYINPFDFDLKLLEISDDDEEGDALTKVISDKCLLITSFISCMFPDRSLTPQETSFIDRCVRLSYLNSGFLDSFDKKDMPTLGFFRDVMAAETENVDEDMKKSLLITLEMYVDGSARYFNHHTNIDIHNRVVSYDIKDLSGVLKTQAMLLVLDNVWNTLSANRDNGRPTWVYIDEIHVLFSNDYCLQFIKSLYKRARKYGGVLTGITQNVEDLLRNEDCRTMISNSEFLILLKQAPADAIRLQDTLHFTESEISFVTNVGAGEGLIVFGGKDKIPFYDRFPTDTKMYRRLSTSFSELNALKREKNEQKEAS